MLKVSSSLLCATRPVRSLAVSKFAASLNCRCNSTVAAVDLETSRLQADLKAALKAKDSFSATVIRSVLSEIYAAGKKATPAVLTQADIISIIRKAELRRLDSVKQFETASREDLAQHEQKEADLLANYLPARPSVEEVDAILQQIIADMPKKENVKKAKGLCVKAFYARVDKSTVDGDLVRRRIDDLWLS